jgi:hypothetical protein
MLAVLLAAGTTPALADTGDNDMTPFYGDSWAHLEAQNPSAVNVPSVAAQPGVDVRATWHNAWSGMRERTADTWHRMTGTADRDDTTRSSAGYDRYGAPATSGGYDRDNAAAGGTTYASPADPQAAPASRAGVAVAPGPAAADVGRSVAGQPMGTTPDRAGPLGAGSGGTVDPTGVGAATMGGSPYGGNQDPSRPDAGSSASQSNP